MQENVTSLRGMAFSCASYVSYVLHRNPSFMDIHSMSCKNCSFIGPKLGFQIFPISNGHHATSGFCHYLACKGACPHQCHCNAPGAWHIESLVNAPWVPKPGSLSAENHMSSSCHMILTHIRFTHMNTLSYIYSQTFACVYIGTFTNSM